jgi:hypothetical protein
MHLVQNVELSNLLAAIAETLDIPDSVYEDAVLKYEDVGAWLAAEDSDLRDFTPQIYPQGSFRLGTVIRPLSDSDEYDIDLVCHLAIAKDATTQSRLKKIIEGRLRKRDDLAAKLEECRRCWRLNFPAQFHMDVLPAIPNVERQPTGILLTDTELVRWQKSNPIAYAEWFYGRMRVIFLEKRAALARELQESIDEVPEWQVKTPLQRAVQLFKRHRDFYFQNNLDARPVSIIITTLAAHAYRNQADLQNALRDIIRDMPRFIEKRGDKWWVANPVDPDENFADKWNEYPDRRLAFLRWLDRLGQDLIDNLHGKTIKEAALDLSPVLGRRVLTKAASSVGVQLPAIAQPMVIKEASAPDLSDARHCQQPIWPQQLSYKATIKAGVYRSIESTRKLWDLTKRPLPKDVALRFAVTTNVPRPYKVEWQVVNTGAEAARAQQLRGDFYRDDDTTANHRWETTAYAGTHWVEAFIIKNGICVARSGRVLVRVRDR